MVIGSRFIDKKGFQSTRLRRFAIRWISGLIKLFTEEPDEEPEPESVTGLLVRGFQVCEIPVEMKERQGGTSSLSNPLKALFYMLKVSLGIMIEATGGGR